MTKNDLKIASLATPVTAAVPTASPAAENASVNELIASIRAQDDQVRAAAWQSAGPFGAPAVKSLAAVMTDPDREVARAAKRALWRIVRQAGRPGATKEANAVVAQLVPLLTTTSLPVRREVLWMLSEIGADEAVAPVAALLADQELREPARCALQHIPGPKATAALKQGLHTAPDEFKPALAVSLRIRGEKVDGYPSQKLVPTKQTSIQRLVT